MLQIITQWQFFCNTMQYCNISKQVTKKEVSKTLLHRLFGWSCLPFLTLSTVALNVWIKLYAKITTLTKAVKYETFKIKIRSIEYPFFLYIVNTMTHENIEMQMRGFDYITWWQNVGIWLQCNVCIRKHDTTFHTLETHKIAVSAVIKIMLN